MTDETRVGRIVFSPDRRTAAQIQDDTLRILERAEARRDEAATLDAKANTCGCEADLTALRAEVELLRVALHQAEMILSDGDYGEDPEWRAARDACRKALTGHQEEGAS